MVTLSDTITNLKQDPIKVFQTSQLNRFMIEKPQPSTVHQGFVGYLNDELVEEKYDNKKVIFSERTKSGWFGFTDKYWQELFVFNSDDKSAISFTKEGENQYKAQIETNNILIQPNESKTHALQLFAGAKDIDVIKEYQQKLNIPHFELSMDFGWFRFLTQPFLHFLNCK